MCDGLPAISTLKMQCAALPARAATSMHAALPPTTMHACYAPPTAHQPLAATHHLEAVGEAIAASSAAA